MWLLPYNALAYDESMWGGMPLVIYGYEPESGQAYIADRSRVGLTVSTDDLDAARSRIKKERQRLILLGAPDDAALADAVRQGLADCVALMTEKPPKGSARNFGLKALQHWADMLQKKSKGSWAKEYPTGRPLLAALTTAYTFMGPAFGKTVQAERDVYADFLDEAAQVLNTNTLENVAALYRAAGDAWQGLHSSLLPDLPVLADAHEAIDRKTALFIESGAAQLDEIIAERDWLESLKTASESDFPLGEDQIADLRASIRERVLQVLEAEEAAVLALKAATLS